MNQNEMQLLVDNLLGRIEIDGVTGQKRLPGIITDGEYTALEKCRALLESSLLPEFPTEESPTSRQREQDVTSTQIDGNEEPSEDFGFDFDFGKSDSDEPKEEPTESAIPEEQQDEPDDKVELSLSSTLLDAPHNPTNYLCIDFGTALSKACMISREDGFEEILPLPLGKEAGQDSYIFPVISSVYISLDNRIYFGQKAIDRSLNERNSATHQRFDSLKSFMMNHPDGEHLDTVVAKPFCPPGFQFSVGALISFYLAYVTDLIDQTAESEHGVPPFTARRYAMPCFDNDRKEWAERELETCLARAQILADTFSEEWDNGIPVKQAISAWKQLTKQTNLPRCLIEGSVTEPLAAISSRLNPDSTTSSKGLIMVIDVGAGTTDFTLFQLNVDTQHKRFQAIEVEGSAMAINKAGDFVDQVLMSTILNRKSITVNHPEYKVIAHDLKLKIRAMKEQLFKNGELEYFLFDGSSGEIDLNDFLSLPAIRDFTILLHETFMRVLDTVDSSWLKESKMHAISVAITGGGANMPMLQKLARGQVNIHGLTLDLGSPTPHVPEWIEEESDLLALEYNQLAVSIGGARKYVIKRQSSQKQYGGSRTHHNATHLEISYAE